MISCAFSPSATRCVARRMCCDWRQHKSAMAMRCRLSTTPCRATEHCFKEGPASKADAEETASLAQQPAVSRGGLQGHIHLHSDVIFVLSSPWGSVCHADTAQQQGCGSKRSDWQLQLVKMHADVLAAWTRLRNPLNPRSSMQQVCGQPGGVIEDGSVCLASQLMHLAPCKHV